MPAVATVLPNSCSQCCQAHALRNLATPLAEADAAFKVALRAAIRGQVGTLLRQEPQTAPDQAGVLTVTGVVPTPTGPPQDRMAPATEGDEVITQLFRPTRSLLTLKGRPPWRLAGIETYERLDNVAACSRELLAERSDARLLQLYQGLKAAVSPCAQTCHDLQQGAAWLRDIAYSLEPTETHTLRGEQVASPLRGYLDTGLRLPHIPSALEGCGLHLDKGSRSYGPGLFHCYDVAGFPRTNNALASRFRDMRRRLLRITGQKGLTQRTLQRQGAWALLPRPPTEAQLLRGFRQIPSEDLAQERRRCTQHRERFRVQSRSRRQTQAQLAQLRRRWAALPPTGTG